MYAYEARAPPSLPVCLSLCTLRILPPPMPPASDLAAGYAEAQRRRIKEVLNERYLLARRVEAESFRRILAAVALFVGYKFVRHRFFGGGGDGGRGGL